MATASILAVPGLSTTTQRFRDLLADMANRHGWNVDAIAAVISNESGFKPSAKNPIPGQTASGLLQWIDSTAKALGIPGGSAQIRTMTAEQQVPIIERFYQRAGLSDKARPVDFYLAGWGSGIGADMGHVLANKDDPMKYNEGKDNLYSLNNGLDTDHNGQITVQDIASLMANIMASAHGERLPVSPLATAPTFPPVKSEPEPNGSSLESSPQPPVSSSHPSIAPRLGPLADLPVLRVNSHGSAVQLFFGVSIYTADLVGQAAKYQTLHGLKGDGIIGRDTWAVFIAELSSHGGK